MIKLFYSPPWMAFVPPEKPDEKDYGYIRPKRPIQNYQRDMGEYEKAYAEAKANALEVGNVDVFILAALTEPIYNGKDYDWNGSAVIKDGKYILSV